MWTALDVVHFHRVGYTRVTKTMSADGTSVRLRWMIKTDHATEVHPHVVHVLSGHQEGHF